MNDLLTTVGFCDECIGIYLAQGLTRGESHPDDDEFLNVVKLPYDEAMAMVANNEIRCV